MGKGKQKKNLEVKLTTSTLEELLKRAQDNINIFNYKEAQLYLQEALKRDPDDLRALETSASLCIETDNLDGAKRCLGRAITLAPENGFSKYLSMGQLLEGKDSLQCYLKGIELINNLTKDLRVSENTTPRIQNEQGNSSNENCEDEMKENKTLEKKLVPNNALNTLNRKLSNAYCAVAELYMSDLCDEEEAETESLAFIQKAITTDSENPEAYQHHANFLLIKGKIDQAKENIKKSVSFWLPKYQEVDDGEAPAGSFDPVEVCPLSQSARFGTSRILIEVEEYQLAADVLETLLGEDDEVVYTWYLLGWNHYLRDDEHKLEAKQHFEKALEIHNSVPSPDDSIIEHMKGLLEELKDVKEETNEEFDEVENEICEMEVS